MEYKSDFDCISGNHLHTARVGTIVLDCLVGLLYTPVISLLLFVKAYKRFLSGLVLFLVVVAFCSVVNDGLKLLAFHSENGTIRVQHKQFCIANGFMAQFLFLIAIEVVFWICLHLFLTTTSHSWLKRRTYKAGGLVILLLFALVFSLIPFIDFGEGVMYGVSGLECWIKDEIRSVKSNGTHCRHSNIGSVERMVLWHVPTITIFTVIGALIAVMLRKIHHTRDINNNAESSMMIAHNEAIDRQYIEFKTILWSLLVYLAICFALEVSVIVIHFTRSSMNGWGSVVITIIEPISLLLLPAGYILSPTALKRLKWSELRGAARRWHRQQESVYTEYEVPPEPEFSSSQQRLVIKGRTRYNISGRYSVIPEEIN